MVLFAVVSAHANFEISTSYDSLGNQTNRVIATAPEKIWTHGWNDNGELSTSERLKPGESWTSKERPLC